MIFDAGWIQRAVTDRWKIYHRSRIIANTYRLKQAIGITFSVGFKSFCVWFTVIMKQIRRCCGIFAHRYNVLTGKENLLSPRHTRQPSVHWKCTLDKNSNEKHVANHTVKNGYKSAFSSDKIIRLDASGLIDEAELKFLSRSISSKREKNVTTCAVKNWYI